MKNVTQEQIQDLISGNRYELGILDKVCTYDLVSAINNGEEAIQALIDNERIVYYANAINFLAKNDPSLKDSLALANEHGLEITDLHSEKLATILLQDMLATAIFEALLPKLEELNNAQ